MGRRTRKENVELLPDGQPDQRMVQRLPVAEVARVRAVAAENRPRPTRYPAVIVDVSAPARAWSCRARPSSSPAG